MKIKTLLILLITTQCVRFQIFDLNPIQIFSIQLQEADSIPELKNTWILPVSIKKNSVYFLPQHPVIFESEMILPIPERNMLIYYTNFSKNPDFILVSSDQKPFVEKNFPPTNIKVFSDGIIGKSCISKHYIFFQIFQKKNISDPLEPIEPENRTPAILYPSTKEVNPSQIVFISKENLQSPEFHLNPIPMEKSAREEIDNFLCNDQNLITFYKKSEHLFLIKEYNLNSKTIRNFQIDVQKLSRNHKEKAFIENVFPIYQNHILLFMVEISFRNSKDFKISKKAIYKFYNDKWEHVFDIDDVNLSLLYVFPDNKMYLAENNEDDLIIRIYDSEFNYIKNNRIRFHFNQRYWKDFFLNQEGRIFSSQLSEHQYIIIEWK